MRYITILLFITLSLIVSAQNKIDYAGNNLPDSISQTYNVIVEFNDADADFGDMKVDVVSRLGSMAVVNVTAAQMKEIAALPQVKTVSLGNQPQLYDEQQQAQEPQV
ncbi:MAG: hypothetical protein K2M00_09020, partial [Muribaculaceae bacterium]|nr:hypothetical protein [Muribaculaceae bacterium]